MALVRIPAQNRTLSEPGEITAFLAANGIDYERADQVSVDPGASAEEVLAAYQVKIDEFKARGGYLAADVLDVFPHTPGLEAMLNKFSQEHWHDDDEVRFIVEGSGLFHIHPPDGPVFAIEVDAGDLIRVPKGTLHWFDLCGSRRIRAIRLFVDPAGWAPRYTGSGVDGGFQPLCFGPAYFPPRIGAGT
jgi:1,2-dihydroxy-3-keto-5-methylthiopentene dioxygenase